MLLILSWAQRMPKKHRDTTILLHPLSLEEAIKTLAHSSKQTDSQADEFCHITEPDPEFEPLKRRASRRRKSFDG